jgi:hypothetical protein
MPGGRPPADPGNGYVNCHQRKWKSLHVHCRFTMAIPPGFSYLLWLFPYFAIPSSAVYVSLRLLDVLTINTPSWLVIAATVLARPTIFLFNFYIGTPWADNRGAVSRGAILPPVVQESTMSIIPRLLEGTRSGYPSAYYFSYFTT